MSESPELNSDEEIENLEKLLLAANEEVNQNPPKKEEKLIFAPKFSDILKNAEQSASSNSKKSEIHTGDTDSSDDEDVRNFLEQKYNQYGRDVKLILKQKEEESNYFDCGKEKRLSLATSLISPITTSAPLPKSTANQSDNKKERKSTIPSNPLVNPNVYCDPVFGLKIVHPLISSAVLVEKMQGKKAISLSRVRFHTEKGDLKADWVVAGVLASKSPPKTSQKGDTYSIWTITDLKDDIKTLTLFLFKNAHSELWKTAVGMVIGILNPGVLDRKDDKVQAVLSISNANRVMILGQSKDLGTCKSLTKNGEKCKAIVNLSSCDVCIYHMKQEYNKTSKRSEFQTTGLGRGLNELRNKVLGNSEVFYGGQSYTSIKATKNVKQMKKDRNTLMTLSEHYQSPFNYEERSGGDAATSLRAQRMLEASNTTKKPRLAASLDVTVNQRKKDLERLKALKGNNEDDGAGPSGLSKSFGSLSGSSQKPTLTQMTSSSSGILTNGGSSLTGKLNGSLSQPATASKLSFIPKLSSGNLSFDIDLKSSYKNELAKQKALQILKKKPLEKTDPNFVKHRGTEIGKKRALEELNSSFPDDSEISETKKQKISEDEEAAQKKERILKIMNAKSSHTDLVEEHIIVEQDKYFKNLERKENMEERMKNTRQLECKAVICIKCKYVAFSAADKCKQEGHELRVKDAVKRFYKCLDCGNRTVTLHRIPTISCKNCQSSRWERTGMMRDKDAKIGEKLSIRGDEEMFMGSLSESANVNLLVPDDQ